MLHDDMLYVTQVAPDYLNNRNSSGVAVPVAFDDTGMTYRATGVGQTCLPMLSASTYLNTDYYLSKPILIIPTNDVDTFGNPIDPSLVAVGCSVP